MSYRFAVSVLGVPADAVKVHSSLDRRYALAVGKSRWWPTWESIVVGRDDVTVLKNYDAEKTATLALRGLEMPHARLVFRPGRQESFVLWQGKRTDCRLEPGESIVIRSEYARDPIGDTLQKQVGAHG